MRIDRQAELFYNKNMSDFRNVTKDRAISLLVDFAKQLEGNIRRNKSADKKKSKDLVRGERCECTGTTLDQFVKKRFGIIMILSGAFLIYYDRIKRQWVLDPSPKKYDGIADGVKIRMKDVSHLRTPVGLGLYVCKAYKISNEEFDYDLDEW